MLVIHQFIKSKELKLIYKLMLWNFCGNTYIIQKFVKLAHIELANQTHRKIADPLFCTVKTSSD